MVDVLGLDDASGASGAAGATASALDALMRTMIEQRARARADKDWAAADRIRDAIAAAGITLEDSPDGTHWSTDG
jgi:cysteinyl-tRNA synthetase